MPKTLLHLYCMLFPRKASRALGRAIADGDGRKVLALMASGAKSASHDFDNDIEPIFLAVRRQQKGVVELLLTNGADINTRDKDGDTPLHEAARIPDEHTEMAEFLLAKGADVSARNKWGSTPLHKAASSNGRKVAALLLAHGAKIDAQDDEGGIPLHHAAWGTWGDEDVIELLLKEGAAVNSRDRRGRTVLHRLAKQNGRERRIELVLARGAEINARDHQGRTPLHVAAEKGTKPIVELLLARGADIEAQDAEGLTAVDVAAIETLILTVKDAGYRATLADVRRGTRMDRAAIEVMKQITELLLAKGVDIEELDLAEAGRVAIAHASFGTPYTNNHPFAWGGRRGIVEFLLDVIDKRRDTRPTAIAESHAEPAIRVLHYGLLRHGFLASGNEDEIRSMEQALLACRKEERIGQAALVVRGLMKLKRDTSATTAEGAS